MDIAKRIASLARHLGAVVVAAVSASLLVGELDREELECEQAFAHLQSCCGGLRGSDACGAGCSEVTLDLGESTCIEDADCDTLRAHDVCHRVEQLSANEANASADRAKVCP
jgi:hypothetical protein